MSEKQEVVFVDGFIFKKPSDNVPDFVKGKVSINIESFAKFVKEHAKNGWLNIDLKESTKGNFYAQLDEWTPETKDEAEVIAPDDLPF